MSLPDGLRNLIQTNEVKDGSGHTEGPTGSTEYKELLNQINGERLNKNVRKIRLSVGGCVIIPLSTYNWVLSYAEYFQSPFKNKDLARAEFVDSDGYAEAVLQIDIDTGEVWSVQVSTRQNSFGETLIPDL